jgi:hypothetical protein
MVYVKNKAPKTKLTMKPVVTNNTPQSELQFPVLKRIESEKRQNPKKVFQNYHPPKNIKRK